MKETIKRKEIVHSAVEDLMMPFFWCVTLKDPEIAMPDVTLPDVPMDALLEYARKINAPIASLKEKGVEVVPMRVRADFFPIVLIVRATRDGIAKIALYENVEKLALLQKLEAGYLKFLRKNSILRILLRLSSDLTPRKVFNRCSIWPLRFSKRLLVRGTFSSKERHIMALGRICQNQSRTYLSFLLCQNI